MCYKQVLERLYGLSKKGITLGLDRVVRAAAMLGNPERHFKSVQIAGTNGKGTVSSTLAHALSRAGIRTGLFTSPHLHRFAERIRIDGKEAPEEILAAHLSRVLDLNDAVPDLSLSFFETATLAGLLTFESMKVEIAVLEVGLGGRLDATTVADPCLTALTSVAMDHTALLGNSIEEIAAEKAGIARNGVPFIASALPPNALTVVERICDAARAPLYVFERDFFADKNSTPPWPGGHHIANVAVAAEMYRLLTNAPAGQTPDIFSQSVSSVFWPGRFEIIQTQRRFILDCAHNMEAALALTAVLTEKNEHPEVLIFGALRDKPAAKMLALYRAFAEQVVLMPPPIDRAEDPTRLAEPGDLVVKNADQALAAAQRISDAGSTVLVTGSLFTVANIRGILLGEPSDPSLGL